MHVPFLSLDQRIDYLYRRQYFPEGSLTQEAQERIGSFNFHYFLGYARNFRMLADQNALETAKEPQVLFELIDHDHRISGELFSAMRNMEWKLRASIVKHYCQKYSSVGSFLQTEQYLQMDADFTPSDMVTSILKHILRYGEGYVVRHIDSKANELGTERLKSLTARNIDAAKRLAEDLPLWSIIDSFSLGLLSRFIMCCDNTSTLDEPSATAGPLWKAVAADFEIPASIFHSSLRSVTNLRNLVAHHSRLWMRPTTDSGRPPKKFKEHLRGTDNKAMHLAFINLGMFQGKQAQHISFANQITEMCQENEPYWHGVSRIRRSK